MQTPKSPGSRRSGDRQRRGGRNGGLNLTQGHAGADARRRGEIVIALWSQWPWQVPAQLAAGQKPPQRCGFEKRAVDSADSRLT
jgi:hypothetical protein